MAPTELQIENALRDLPLEPLPQAFTRRVMARVWAAAPRPRPRFHFEFVDLAVPAFVAFFGTGLAFAALRLALAADPFLGQKLQLWIPYLWMQAEASPLLPLAVLGAAGLGVLALLGMGLGLFVAGSRRVA